MLSKINEYLPLITTIGILFISYFVLRGKEIIRKELKDFKSELIPELEKTMDLKLAKYEIKKHEQESHIKIVRRVKKT